MEKTDIRIRFTRKTLQESLVGLMKEKSILDITIREICERAGLSRSTFYTYYNDQYDLLRQIEEETFIEIDKISQSYLSEVKKLNESKTTVVLEDMLQFIVDSGNSIQVLLSENGDSAFQKKFFRNSVELTQRFATATGIKALDGRAAKYGSVFLVGGLLMLVQEWLNNGMDTPVPELAKMLAKLTRELFR
ncbi:hypothetical protein Holit_01051 [Hollandina sp. SP2]